MVDDLHDEPGIDAGEIAQELEVQVGLVVQRGHHGDHVAGSDAHLGLVVSLANRPGQLLAEARLEAFLEAAVHA